MTSSADSPYHSSRGIILVVEDNAEVRNVAVGQLRTLGYAVVEAENASAALAVLNSQQRVDLLFTDVVMPGGMTGLELGHEAQRMRPGLPVLYTSGFADATLPQEEEFLSRTVLLPKPYRIRDLARKVEDAITADQVSDRR
ncbi:MAG TPA: response regulator [Alphaproteobacteria bacterium]|jgi:CheY-like chemotaxis protein|nr:response regulator [Alphaproteobacteria bacterium]